MIKIPFNNSYARLSDDFYSKTNPTSVKHPGLIRFNQALADELGLTGIDPDDADALGMFSGNTIPEGAEPIAMAYAGHQFGGFSHQLGDGRAILLGEIIAGNTGSQDAIRYDIQLKGSGVTPWSRGGDGRSSLGPVLREYLVSEAMAKLGVPTTRALAAVTSGEEVARDKLLPGGILTRIAQGFVRVGTFEYFSARKNLAAITQLADYVIERHYPQAKQAENRYAAFLAEVTDRQAKLIAQWMHLGFIHGVMNTDNMSVAGETIDYGPCAFMDEFEFNRVYSSIDRNGRYAYNNQPKIGQWNLVRLAEAMLPLLGEGEAAVTVAENILNGYTIRYKKYWLDGMRRKLGLSQSMDDDEALVLKLLETMENNQADFILTFFHLSQLSLIKSNQDELLRALFTKPDECDGWLKQWRERLLKESSEDAKRQAMMQAVNPAYIPRNHQIEAAIRAAEDHNDFSVFHDLHDVLQNPYEIQAGKDRYLLPPRLEEVVQQTFCGT